MGYFVVLVMSYCQIVTVDRQCCERTGTRVDPVMCVFWLYWCPKGGRLRTLLSCLLVHSFGGKNELFGFF